MSEKTGISWTDATFNPWWGCQKVSPACDHCYAERDAKRFAAGRVLWGVGSERRTFADKHWEQPLKWAARGFAACSKCEWRGEQHAAVSRDAPGETMPFCPECGGTVFKARRRVFCASMGDWLDLEAPLEEFVRLLDTIRRTPELDWLLLSKRIGNWRGRLSAALAHMGSLVADDARDALAEWVTGWLVMNRPPANVWLGATVIDQAEADRDIPKLLAVPAHVRFLSIEPMLGPIDLTKWLQLGRCTSRGGGPPPFRCGLPAGHDEEHTALIETGARWFGVTGELHWVIAGGESGMHARPAHLEWFRSLRDQCAAAGVPFHFKQWGEWALWEHHPHHTAEIRDVDGRTTVVRVGKAAAGRLLDGVTHDEFPA